MRVSDRIRAAGSKREGVGQDDMKALLTNLETAQDSIDASQKRLRNLATSIDPSSDSLFRQVQDKVDKCGMVIVKTRNMLRKIKLK